MKLYLIPSAILLYHLAVQHNGNGKVKTFTSTVLESGGFHHKQIQLTFWRHTPIWYGMWSMNRFFGGHYSRHL